MNLQLNDALTAIRAKGGANHTVLFVGCAVGVLAAAAISIGAVAVGAVAIGRLAVGRGSIRRLEIGELVVGKLRVVDELQVPGKEAPVVSAVRSRP